MGNKHAKPRGSSNAKREELPTARPQQQQQSALPPAAPVSAAQYAPPPVASGKPPRPAAAANSSHLEFKLSQLDVSTIFAPHEIQAIRKHLAGLLGQSESDPVVIPKDEFFRFLGTTSSSLYVNRLYSIFDLSGNGYVRTGSCIWGLRGVTLLWCTVGGT